CCKGANGERKDRQAHCAPAGARTRPVNRGHQASNIVWRYCAVAGTGAMAVTQTHHSRPHERAASLRLASAPTVTEMWLGGEHFVNWPATQDTPYCGVCRD